MRIFLFLMVVLFFAGCASAPTATQEPATRARQSATTFDIHVATKELFGKTPQEIVHDLGRPNREFGYEHWQWWTYDYQFYDSITQRVLPAVTLVFHNGKLADVTF
jgi:hypothetical protein